MKKLKSTKKQFKAFCEVRNSGATNMFYSTVVERLSEGIVDEDAHIDIIKNFNDYAKKYPKIAKRRNEGI